MPNPFTTLAELFESTLQGHIDPAKIDKILTNQETIKGALSKIIDSQESAALARIDSGRVAATAAADLVSIKAFLEIPDARIVATQDQLNTLGSLLKKETDAVEQFDGSFQTPVTDVSPTQTTKE